MQQRCCPHRFAACESIPSLHSRQTFTSEPSRALATNADRDSCDEVEILRKALLLHRLIRHQSNQFKSKPFPQDFSNSDVKDVYHQISPHLWNFLYLLSDSYPDRNVDRSKHNMGESGSDFLHFEKLWILFNFAHTVYTRISIFAHLHFIDQLVNHDCQLLGKTETKTTAEKGLRFWNQWSGKGCIQ